MKRWKVTETGIHHKCTKNGDWRMYFARDAWAWYTSFSAYFLCCRCRYIKPPAKIERMIKLYDFYEKIRGYGDGYTN